jgi:hypothetical protein
MMNRAVPSSVVVAVCGWLTASTPAFAQDEAALRAAFEGRRVALRMNMPGSASGVDVHMEAGRSVDYREYEKDLIRFGVALYAGDITTVTLVKVKKDLVEFQLGGGGFGTFSDDTSTSSGITMLDKSPREKDLEKRIDKETNRDAKRRMQYELSDLRERRERENRRRKIDSDRIEARKREEIAAKRLGGGSRFNLTYAKRVPVNLHAEDIVAALREYVDFDPSAHTAGRPGASRDSAPRAADLSALRKGMSRGEAEHAFGRPVNSRERREGGLITTTLTFDAGEQQIVADFVEDVLIRYTVASK